VGRRLLGKKKWIALAGAVVVAAGAVGGWALARPDESSATTPITATATVGTIRQTVAATGTLAPAQRADLTFQVSGTVTTVPVTVGDKVAKGATVATIDDTDLQTAVDAAQAGVTSAQDQVDAAGGGSSAQVASAQAQLAAAQSSLARAKASLADATLSSPIAGTVAAVSIAAGDAVGSGSSGSGGSGSTSGGSTSSDTSTAQVVVIATNAWVVNASVGASDLASVKKGLQVDITPDGSTERVFGTVSSVGIMASTGSSGAATFPVVIKVTGSPTGLYAGGTVSAAIVVKQVDDVLTVPSAALTSEGDATYVTVSKAGKETRTKVVIGTVYGASTQITSGLSEGDQVVVRQVRLPAGGTGGTNQGQRNGEVPGQVPGGGQVREGEFPGGGPAGSQAPVGAGQ
jgi:multidrug efflux pump subunit AcrA (membrane-fusion protein)